MSAMGKYRIIEAETLAARIRHRTLIEDVLGRAGLSPELQKELEAELKRAISKEDDARALLEDIIDEEEEEKKKKGEEGEGGGQGSAGEGGSAGGSSGGDTGGGWIEETSEEFEDLSVFEIATLLFFLAEQDFNGTQPVGDVINTDIKDDQALGAATLLYSEGEEIAHIHEPYSSEDNQTGHTPTTFLPSLERHAASIGAKVMLVKAHADAIELLKKHGYEPHGAVFTKAGTPLQRMRKTISQRPLPTNKIC